MSRTCDGVFGDAKFWNKEAADKINIYARRGDDDTA